MTLSRTTFIHMYLLACLLALTACRSASVSELAQAGYYASIDRDATGDVLKAQLHELIDDHHALSNRMLWESLAFTDADPTHPGNVLLIYTGWSLPADFHGTDPSGWNREHIWAKSRGDFGTRMGAGTDLHLIRPADVTVNNARSNRAFDDGGDLYTDNDGPTRCRRDADSWEPRDEVKGDVARAILYAVVRYEEPDLDLELTEDAREQGDKAPVHGVRSTLLRWHELDPPDDSERVRNDRVESLQGNRNPFVDHPEWVKRVWSESP